MYQRRNAFTLIELLVSMMLITIIITTATTIFVQMWTFTQRMQSLQTMDAQAKTIYEKLAGEVTAIHPCAALWLKSNSVSQEVEFVFMRSKFDRLDYMDSKIQWKAWNEESFKSIGYTDMVWSRWHWKGVDGILEASSSRTCRWSQVSNDAATNFWKIGGNMGKTTSTFVSVPQLVRDTGIPANPITLAPADLNSPIGILNLNSWQPVVKTDIGDYDDLIINAAPILYNCTALTIELMNLDGSVKTADGTAPLTWSSVGTYVNGQDQPSSELLSRPSVVRLRFTLTNAKTKTSRSYSFSCSTPSFTHY